MPQLTVRRKGFSRKAFTIMRNGKKIKMPATKVSPTTYKETDRGAPGRGKKVIPKLKSGALGGKGFFMKPKSIQKEIVFKVAKEKGERVAMGRLAALQSYFKRTEPKYSKRAKELRTEVAGSFKGKKQVPYGQGFRRKRRSM